MKPFDIASASDAEIVAEAERRWQERDGRFVMTGDDVGEAFAPHGEAVIRPAYFSLVIPFALLVSDNERTQPIVRRNQRGNGYYPQIVLTAKYKKAKAAIKKLAKAGNWTTLTGPVAVTAVVYEPDRKRTRDLTNWAKQVTDALTGVAYEDDGQIDSSTWVRGGVRQDNPHMHIRVESCIPRP